MGLLLASKAMLLYRDDKGRDGCEQALWALPGIRRLGGGFLAQTTVAALAYEFVLVVYGAYFGVSRIGGDA